MSSKNILLVLGLSLVLAILISSEVSARELTEDTNTKHEEADHTNGLEESKYPYGGGYNGGGYNRGGGYNGGGYNRGWGYNRGGGYNGGGGYNWGGGCYYGCCGGYGGGYYDPGGCSCCATASEAAQYKQANP